MSDRDEKTPTRQQTPWDLVFSELTTVKGLCQLAADNTLATREAMKGVIARVATLEEARIADRVSWYWTPLFISSLSFAGMLWLAFKFGHG